MAHLVTGYAGHAHIKSADDGAYNAAFFGSGQYVMESGNDNCFAGSIIDNNTVRILDGEGLMYGRHFRIEPNTYEDMTIETGTTGMNRIDLICMTYEKDADNETETAYLEVIKGTEISGTASAPACTNGNILAGATFNQMPLYKVTIKGVVLSNIEPMFEKLPSYEKLGQYYYEKHETLAEEYYEKYEKAIEENVGELIEIPSKVTAQVETNTAKLEALADLGSGGILKKEISLSGTLKTGEITTVYTFPEEEFDALLERGSYYSYLIEEHTSMWGYIKSDLTHAELKDVEGYIHVVLVGAGNMYLHSQKCPLFLSEDDSEPHFTINLMIPGLSQLVEYNEETQRYVNGFSYSRIEMRPYIFKRVYQGQDASGVDYYDMQELEASFVASLPMKFSAVKIGHKLNNISGGGELPEIDYTELDNKPTINGVVVEGDLTSADLGLNGGSGESGVASLTDLGVEATAEELNYMTNVTGDVQTQLDNKAESNHSHSGYATTTTTDSLADRITTLESGTSFVFSDTEPTEVAENTIVLVYETE